MSEQILAEIRATRQREANNIADRQAAEARHRAAYARHQRLSAELGAISADSALLKDILTAAIVNATMTIVGSNYKFTPDHLGEGSHYQSPVRAITGIAWLLAGMADVAATFRNPDSEDSGFQWFYRTARMLAHNLREIESGAPPELFLSMAKLGLYPPGSEPANHQPVTRVQYDGRRTPLDIPVLLRDPAFRGVYTKAKAFSGALR